MPTLCPCAGEGFPRTGLLPLLLVCAWIRGRVAGLMQLLHVGLLVSGLKEKGASSDEVGEVRMDAWDRSLRVLPTYLPTCLMRLREGHGLVLP